jgi:hypothetical protein
MGVRTPLKHLSAMSKIERRAPIITNVEKKVLAEDAPAKIFDSCAQVHNEQHRSLN